MWVLFKDVLTRLPDDAPVPKGARAIDVPDDFRANPRKYRISNGRVIRAKPQPPAESKNLTPDEVAKLKRALASGAIGRATTKAARDSGHAAKKGEEEPK